MEGIAFGVYTADEIRKLSVKHISNPITFDSLGHPTSGGLYDPALGPLDNMDRCQTCSLLGTHCPGHIGHVELPLYVYHPIFFHQCFALLRAMCRICHRMKATTLQTHCLVTQLKLLDFGLLVAAQELPEEMDRMQSDDLLKEIDRFYAKSLKRAGLNPASAIPNRMAKHINVEAYRRDIIRAYLTNSLQLKSCSHCGAAARGLAHENCIKVFAKPLKASLFNKMASKNLLEQAMIPKSASDYQRKALDEQPDVKDEDMSVDSEMDSGQDSSSSEDEGVESADEQGNPKMNKDRSSLNSKIYITPVQAREHLNELWSLEYDALSRIFSSLAFGKGQGKSFKKTSTPDMFFVKVLPVPANRFRPASKMGDKTFENPQTMLMTAVLKDCTLLEELAKSVNTGDEKDQEEFERRRRERLNATWHNLQQHVNTLMDSSMNPRAAQEPTPGIRQVLERKEGLFRMHMMGKRVNYAARSVISPDPMIGTHEIGVPHTFAIKLTYPEPVTNYNVHKLRQCVINGPDLHPGATHIEMEDGHVIQLPKDKEARISLADQLLTPQGNEMSRSNYGLPKRVLRHIRNGDWVLMNRQPTLHKSSIMAHQVRVLPGERTLRLHYANCKTYNADFDGDEMNLHFPQNEFARADAMNIAATHHQYIGLAGGPLRGLIQDHLIAAVRMTCRDAFYDRDHYQHLVYAALPEEYNGKPIIHLQPAMIKPRRLWTGKQVVSTILINLTRGRLGLNLVSKAKIKNSWASPSNGLEGESTVLIRSNQLLIGVLDKNQCGATPNGVIHAVFELYGGETASALLTAFGKVWTAWLKFHAASLSIDDLLLTDEANQKRREIIDASADEGRKAAASYVNQVDVNDTELLRTNLETILRDQTESKGLDSAMMSVASKTQSQVISATVPCGLIKAFPHNFFQLMVQSGAKGSPVNATQISCMLGQQALEGRRVPSMPSGKTLPSFKAFDASLRAGGTIFDRFLTGLRPQEYYFHCMAGREGLVDTAVKTSRSGYLQRCLIKHLEDLRVNYDMTVRDADSSVVQFRYGEDALDVTKVAQLKQFDFLRDNYVAFLDRYNATEAVKVFDGKYGKKAIKLHKKALEEPGKYPPVLCSLNPMKYFGCVSEQFSTDIKKYVKENQTKFSGDITDKKFRQLMYLKSLRSLAEPGEPVGILAAQAIGEPSTQMTLNTFHFAGRSEMNVTLGIPRLREIVMTASKESKTPIMSVPIMNNNASKAKEVAASLQPVTLQDVLQSVESSMELAKSLRGQRKRQYSLILNFIDPAEYKEKFDLDSDSLISTLERVFIRKLPKIALKSVSKTADKLGEEEGLALEDVETEASKDKAEVEVDDSDEDSDDDDEEELGEEDGTTATRAQSKHEEGGTYGNMEDDDSAYPGDESSSSSSDEEDEEDEDDNEDGSSKKSKKKKLKSRTERINDVLGSSPMIAGYKYASDGTKLQVTLAFDCNLKTIGFVRLIEQIAKKVVIRATKGVKRCVVSKSKEELEQEDTLQVEGLNIRAIWKHANIFEVNKLRVNDVTSMLMNYGVEAARAAIIRELNAVFSVYGISVNYRHLSLVADYMTFEGDYRGMNRISMKSNVNPFHKMSFETTTDFLRSATLGGDFDNLKSNSSRLVVGAVSKGGSGGIDVLQPLNLTQNSD